MRPPLCGVGSACWLCHRPTLRITLALMRRPGFLDPTGAIGVSALFRFAWSGHPVPVPSPLSRPFPWVVSASLDLACARASSVRRVPARSAGRPARTRLAGLHPRGSARASGPRPPRVFRPAGRIGRHLSSVGGALPAFRPSVAPACCPLAASGARPGRRRTGAHFPGVRAPRVAFPVGSGLANRPRVFSARACRFALASLPMRLVLAAKEHLASLKNRVWLRPSGTWPSGHPVRHHLRTSTCGAG